MALTVTESKIVDFRDADSGPSGNRYTVVWAVKTNKAAPGVHVVQAANASGTPQPLPAAGDSLNITHDGETYTDEAAFAQSFRVKSMADQGTRTKHEVTVTYEPIAASRAASPANPNNNINPLERPIRRTLDWISEQELITEGRNVQAIRGRAAGTAGQIVNAAGFPVRDAHYRPVDYPVIVMRKYVTDYIPAITIHNDFKDTYNAETWSNVGAKRARWLRPTITGPNYWNGVQYFEFTARVALSQNPWYLNVENMGSSYYAGGQLLRVKSDEGSFGSDLMVPLDLQGEQADIAALLQYETLTEANYNELDTAINNYR